MTQHHVPIVRVPKDVMCLGFIMMTNESVIDYLVENKMEEALPLVPEYIGFIKKCHEFFEDHSDDSFMIMVEGMAEIKGDDCPVIEMLAGKGKE